LASLSVKLLAPFSGGVWLSLVVLGVLLGVRPLSVVPVPDVCVIAGESPMTSANNVVVAIAILINTSKWDVGSQHAATLQRSILAADPGKARTCLLVERCDLGGGVQHEAKAA
jgi:hypothetical protein